MGNPGSTADERDEEFDPWLGCLAGETWWELGRNLAPTMTDEPAERAKHIAEWAKEMRELLLADDMKVEAKAVTSSALTEFVDTLMSVLERKYEGKPIAGDVRRLMRRSGDYQIADDGQYIVVEEHGEVFWANEFRYLFEDLQRYTGRGWLNAVGRCEGDGCGRFFVKTRIDQRFHADTCRTRTANRKAYRRKQATRLHTGGTHRRGGSA